MRIAARFAVALVAILAANSAFAWNALGHKVVAEIAWQRLSPEQRTEIVRTLRRHPRFDEDFAKRIDETGDDDHLVFLHAATWPDIARGIRGPDRSQFGMGPRHYVNFPLLINHVRPAEVNLAVDRPRGPAKQWNIAQATRFSLATIEDDQATPQQNALAYCWLFYLVGDMPQPLHSTALFCERFPADDRGGNPIKTRQGRILHSL